MCWNESLQGKHLRFGMAADRRAYYNCGLHLTPRFRLVNHILNKFQLDLRHIFVPYVLGYRNLLLGLVDYGIYHL